MYPVDDQELLRIATVAIVARRVLMRAARVAGRLEHDTPQIDCAATRGHDIHGTDRRKQSQGAEGIDAALVLALVRAADAHRRENVAGGRLQLLTVGGKHDYLSSLREQATRLVVT